MKRRVGLPKRTGWIARKGPPRKRNPKRQVSAFRHAYFSKTRVRLVGSLPCSACGDTDPRIPRENAHTEPGMGRKAHYTTIVPLCHRCHHKQHQSGWSGIGMTAESRRRAADLTQTAWRDHLDGMALAWGSDDD